MVILEITNQMFPNMHFLRIIALMYWNSQLKFTLLLSNCGNGSDKFRTVRFCTQ